MNENETINECKNCPNHTANNSCIRYSNPYAFVRSNGKFMCPSQSMYSYTNEKNSKARIGQQKQKKGR